jgi:hypothetical protein
MIIGQEIAFNWTLSQSRASLNHAFRANGNVDPRFPIFAASLFLEQDKLGRHSAGVLFEL